MRYIIALIASMVITGCPGDRDEGERWEGTVEGKLVSEESPHEIKLNRGYRSCSVRLKKSDWDRLKKGDRVIIEFGPDGQFDRIVGIYEREE